MDVISAPFRANLSKLGVLISDPVQPRFLCAGDDPVYAEVVLLLCAGVAGKAGVESAAGLFYLFCDRIYRL